MFPFRVGEKVTCQVVPLFLDSVSKRTVSLDSDFSGSMIDSKGFVIIEPSLPLVRNDNIGVSFSFTAGSEDDQYDFTLGICPLFPTTPFTSHSDCISESYLDIFFPFVNTNNVFPSIASTFVCDTPSGAVEAGDIITCTITPKNLGGEVISASYGDFRVAVVRQSKDLADTELVESEPTYASLTVATVTGARPITVGSSFTVQVTIPASSKTTNKIKISGFVQNFPGVSRSDYSLLSEHVFTAVVIPSDDTVFQCRGLGSGVLAPSTGYARVGETVRCIYSPVSGGSFITSLASFYRVGTVSEEPQSITGLLTGSLDTFGDQIYFDFLPNPTSTSLSITGQMIENSLPVTLTSNIEIVDTYADFDESQFSCTIHDSDGELLDYDGYVYETNYIRCTFLPRSQSGEVVTTIASDFRVTVSTSTATTVVSSISTNEPTYSDNNFLEGFQTFTGVMTYIYEVPSYGTGRSISIVGEYNDFVNARYLEMDSLTYLNLGHPDTNSILDCVGTFSQYYIDADTGERVGFMRLTNPGSSTEKVACSITPRDLDFDDDSHVDVMTSKITDFEISVYDITGEQMLVTIIEEVMETGSEKFVIEFTPVNQDDKLNIVASLSAEAALFYNYTAEERKLDASMTVLVSPSVFPTSKNTLECEGYYAPKTLRYIREKQSISCTITSDETSIWSDFQHEVIVGGSSSTITSTFRDGETTGTEYHFNVMGPSYKDGDELAIRALLRKEKEVDYFPFVVRRYPLIGIPTTSDSYFDCVGEFSGTNIVTPGEKVICTIFAVSRTLSPVSSQKEDWMWRIDDGVNDPVLRMDGIEGEITDSEFTFSFLSSETAEDTIEITVYICIAIHRELRSSEVGSVIENSLEEKCILKTIKTGTQFVTSRSNLKADMIMREVVLDGTEIQFENTLHVVTLPKQSDTGSELINAPINIGITAENIGSYATVLETTTRVSFMNRSTNFITVNTVAGAQSSQVINVLPEANCRTRNNALLAVDYENVIDESDETNNEYSFDIKLEGCRGEPSEHSTISCVGDVSGSSASVARFEEIRCIIEPIDFYEEIGDKAVASDFEVYVYRRESEFNLQNVTFFKDYEKENFVNQIDTQITGIQVNESSGEVYVVGFYVPYQDRTTIVSSEPKPTSQFVRKLSKDLQTVIWELEVVPSTAIYRSNDIASVHGGQLILLDSKGRIVVGGSAQLNSGEKLHNLDYFQRSSFSFVARIIDNGESAEVEKVVAFPCDGTTTVHQMTLSSIDHILVHGLVEASINGLVVGADGNRGVTFQNARAVYVIRLSENMDILWTHLFQVDTGEESSNGHIIYPGDATFSGRDEAILSFSAIGEVYSERALVAEHQDSEQSTASIVMARLDASGDVLNAKYFSDTFCYSHGVVVTSDDRVVVLAGCSLQPGVYSTELLVFDLFFDSIIREKVGDDTSDTLGASFVSCDALLHMSLDVYNNVYIGGMTTRTWGDEVGESTIDSRPLIVAYNLENNPEFLWSKAINTMGYFEFQEMSGASEPSYELLNCDQIGAASVLTGVYVTSEMEVFVSGTVRGESYIDSAGEDIKFVDGCDSTISSCYVQRGLVMRSQQALSDANVTIAENRDPDTNQLTSVNATFNAVSFAATISITAILSKESGLEPRKKRLSGGVFNMVVNDDFELDRLLLAADEDISSGEVRFYFGEIIDLNIIPKPATGFGNGDRISAAEDGTDCTSADEIFTSYQVEYFNGNWYQDGLSGPNMLVINDSTGVSTTKVGFNFCLLKQGSDVWTVAISESTVRFSVEVYPSVALTNLEVKELVNEQVGDSYALDFDPRVLNYEVFIPKEVRDVVVGNGIFDRRSIMFKIFNGNTDRILPSFPFDVQNLPFGSSELQIEIQNGVEPDKNERVYSITFVREGFNTTSLSSLAVSSEAILLPSFDPATTEYVMSVPSAGSYEIRIAAEIEGTTFDVYLGDVETGTQYTDLAITIPFTISTENLNIKVVVISETKTARVEFNILVSLASNNWFLKTLSLSSPDLSEDVVIEINKDNLFYDYVVDWEVDEVTIVPVADDDLSTVEVIGGNTVALAVGSIENQIQIVVTAQAQNKRSYTLTIERKPNTNTRIRDITIRTESGGEQVTAPPFDQARRDNYLLDVPKEDYILNITVSLFDDQTEIVGGKAKVYLNNVFISDGEPTIYTLETVGQHELRFRVVAADGLNSGEYVINVNRIGCKFDGWR